MSVWGTSTLTGVGAEAYVAILVDGNPLVLSNEQSGSTLTADPDALVSWIGADPGFKLDLSWKNLIGQASGESYMFEWGAGKQATIIMQPNEREGSGINIGMDGGSSGERAQAQQNQTLRQASSSVGETLGQLGNILGGGSGGIGGLFG